MLRWAYAIAALIVPGTIVSDIWLDVDYEWLANWALIAAMLLVNGFTLLYGFRSRWKTNPIGPVYLVKCVALSLFLIQATASVWTDQDYPFRHQIRFAIYTYAALVYVPMLAMLWLAQQRDRTGSTPPLELPPGVPPL